MNSIPETLLFLVFAFFTTSECFTRISTGNSMALGSGIVRQGKFIPIVFLFKYDRTCKFEDIDGLCLNSEKDCAKRGGRLSPGKCSRGLFQGVCCQPMMSCTEDGGTLQISKNLTKIKVPTPGMPAKECTYRMQKMSGICQLRLDFKDFALSTSMGGKCLDNRMKIEGDDVLGNLTLCGDMDPGTHIYLNYGMADAITISTTLPEIFKSRFEIQVSFIECSSAFQAPSGCTQYYTSKTDEVKSFNFPKQQLNSQMYMICVKSPPGMKLIKWEKCKSRENIPQFFISGSMMNPAMIMAQTNTVRRRLNNRNKEFAVASRENRGVSNFQQFEDYEDSDEGRAIALIKTASKETGSNQGNECTGDFISIHGTNNKDDKFCGRDFKGVTSRAKPFQLFVNFDDMEHGIEQMDGMDATMRLMCPPPAIRLGEICVMSSPSSQNNTAPPDIGNTGFCLRYTVT